MMVAMRRPSALLFMTLILASCSGATATTAAPVMPSVGAPSATATIAAPTAAPTAVASPSVVAGTPCIISSPSQAGTAIEDVVVVYPGATDAQCNSALRPTDAWSVAHPPTRLTSAPSGTPVCDKMHQGEEFIVYGGAAAKLVCSML